MNTSLIQVQVVDNRAEWFAKWEAHESERIRQEYSDQSSRTVAGGLAPFHVEHEGEQQ